MTELGNPLDRTSEVVVVTGGTAGIGFAIAERFLAEGAVVVVCGRNPPKKLPSVLVRPDGNDYEAYAREAVFVEADVRETEQADRVIDKTFERFGRLDVLVNNAGGSPMVDAATASPRFSQKILELNLMAPLYLAQRANLIMQLQEKGGCIVNVASVSGVRPSPGTAAYGAAKAGLLSLTQSLAVEWAPKVRVNAITVGLVRTEKADMHYGSEEKQAAVAATVPLGRMGEPRDVADACLFFASDLARYVSGANLLLHGGGEWPAFLSAARGG